MKSNRSLIVAFILLIVVGSVFRVAGFAPQIAMAVFGAAVIADKRLAFVLPLVSMFLSDIIYQLLYESGYMAYGGFYEGQVTNYLILAGITLTGFWARNLHWSRILASTLAAPLLFFVVSNFFVWQAGAGLARPKTWEGLMMCYNDALPFLRSGLTSTVVFSALLFGGYFLVHRYMISRTRFV
jgi:hypothetical protein